MFNICFFGILIKNLEIKPKKRLGHSEGDAHEIKNHPFFKGIDWEKIIEKSFSPPFKPKLLNEQDLRYFDKV